MARLAIRPLQGGSSGRRGSEGALRARLRPASGLDAAKWPRVGRPSGQVSASQLANQGGPSGHLNGGARPPGGVRRSTARGPPPPRDAPHGGRQGLLLPGRGGARDLPARRVVPDPRPRGAAGAAAARPQRPPRDGDRGRRGRLPLRQADDRPRGRAGARDGGDRHADRPPGRASCCSRGCSARSTPPTRRCASA